MIESILDQSLLKQGHEISFILGHTVLAKTNNDWFEIQGDALSVGDWEDLKDFCLQSNEKIQLETKGYVSGLYQSERYAWKFSFVEKKDCFRAFLTFVQDSDKIQSGIEYPLFWDSLKKVKGIFIVCGERRQGKSTLLAEIVANDQKSRMSLTGIHSPNQYQKWPQVESIIHLGADALEWENGHTIYEGIERIVVDFNTIKNWRKWIEFAEQGQSVFLSMGADSLTTLFFRVATELEPSLVSRFIQVFNGGVVQKLIGPSKLGVHEILVCREKEKRKLIEYYEQKQNFQLIQLGTMGFDSYHSLNQSIIQKLIRRKIDVQSAFSASDAPDELDAQLKKMGL